eukprot:gene16914-biopygen17294
MARAWRGLQAIFGLGGAGHPPRPHQFPVTSWEKRPRPRPVRVRFFKFYRAPRVRSASAAVFPWGRGRGADEGATCARKLPSEECMQNALLWRRRKLAGFLRGQHVFSLATYYSTGGEVGTIPYDSVRFRTIPHDSVRVHTSPYDSVPFHTVLQG